MGVTPLTVEQLKARGNAEFKAEAYSAAVATYGEVLRLGVSDDSIPRDLLSIVASNAAEACLKLGDFSQAVSLCEESARHNPQYFKSLWRKGRGCAGLAKDDPGQAKAHLEAALDAHKRTLEIVSANKEQARFCECVKTSIAEVEKLVAALAPPRVQTVGENCRARLFSNDARCLHELQEQGYSVLDDYFTAADADSFLQELKDLMVLTTPKSFQTPNRTFFKDAEGHITPFDKPHIYEIDLHAVFTNEHRRLADAGKDEYAFAARYPKFHEMFTSEEIPVALEEASDGEWHLDKGAGRYAIKLQWNKGGGSFPWHIDNPGNNKRRITAVVYLNKAWKEGDGGEVVLMPFLGDEVVVAPRFNRCVLFLSEVMNHKVLPATVERYCFSTWYDKHPEAPANLDVFYKTPLKHLSHVPPSLEYLRKPSVQRTLSRLVYEEEYIESMDACIPDKESSAHKGLLSMHRTHVLGIKEANKESGLLSTIETLREAKKARAVVRVH